MRQLVRAKRHKMVRAFAVLQQQREGEGPVVSRADWNQLVQRVQPDFNSAHRELLWSVCDDKNQGCIGTACRHTHTHARKKTCAHTHHMNTHTNKYARTYTHTLTLARTHTRTLTRAHSQKRAHTHTHNRATDKSYMQ